MHERSYYFINALTLYRLFMAPVLVLLIVNGELQLFRWLLLFSFFTDAIDGILSRRFKVSSTFGSRIDSVADDLNILAAITGMIVLRPEFIREQLPVFAILAGLFLLQIILSIFRYKKFTSFHTYAAKGAAVLQGIFFILFFFLETPPYWLFYLAAALTIADLIEEIILVLLLKYWRNDVKGLYWVLKDRYSAAN